MAAPGTKNLVLAVMIFAVAMTFIDQTIVAAMMVVAFIVALVGMPGGKVEDADDPEPGPEPAAPSATGA